MLLLKPTIQLNGKKYKIISQIGEGAFGYVYHAKSVAKETKYENYAIKKMICQTPEQTAEAKKEIDIMIKLAHTNILPLIDFMYHTNKAQQEEVLLLLPLYETSAQQIIDNGPGYPYCPFQDGLDLVKILRHTIDGLIAVHQAGFRHGDLKPGNILLTKDFNAVITDFGSCAPIPITVSSRTEALEVQENAAATTTASYRPPELFDTPSSITIDGKSDIWSFGCLMYCLMYSRTPFEKPVEGLSTLSVMTAQYHYPPENIWPEDYKELIDKCLTLDPATRIAVNDVQVALRRLSGPPLDLKVPEKAKEEKSPHVEKDVKKSSFFNIKLPGTSPAKSNMEGIGSDSYSSNKMDVPSSSVAPPVISKSLDFADFSEPVPANPPDPDPAIKTDTSSTLKVCDSSEDPFNSSNDGITGGAFDDLSIIGDQTNSANEQNDEIDDEEFGDFTSTNVRRASSVRSPPAEKSRSTSTEVTRSVVAAPEELQKTIQSTHEEIIDLHHVIVNEIATKKILKEGSVYCMRLGGFPKRIMKKSNWLILTPTGLVLRKDKQIHSKIHEILTFHRPLSITPTDTLSVGMNGLLICGWRPLPLFSGDHEDDSEGEVDVKPHSSDNNHSQQSPSATDDSDIWYTLRYKQSPLDGTDAQQKDFKTRANSGINIEISFTDKDIMNQWIDEIMNQYQLCVDNILLQRL